MSNAPDYDAWFRGTYERQLRSAVRQFVSADPHAVLEIAHRIWSTADVEACEILSEFVGRKDEELRQDALGAVARIAFLAALVEILRAASDDTPEDPEMPGWLIDLGRRFMDNGENPEQPPGPPGPSANELS